MRAAPATVAELEGVARATSPPLDEGAAATGPAEDPSRGVLALGSAVDVGPEAQATIAERAPAAPRLTTSDTEALDHAVFAFNMQAS